MEEKDITEVLREGKRVILMGDSSGAGLALAFAKEYTGQDDHAAFDAQAGRFGVYVHKLMKQYYS